MQELPTEDRPKFVAVDLNNLPFINLSNIDGASLVSQHNAMKENLDAVLAEQQTMRSQLVEIKKLLQNRGQVQTNAVPSQNAPADASEMRETSNDPIVDSVDTPETNPTASEESSGSTVTYASITATEQ